MIDIIATYDAKNDNEYTIIIFRYRNTIIVNRFRDDEIIAYDITSCDDETILSHIKQ